MLRNLVNQPVAIISVCRIPECEGVKESRTACFEECVRWCKHAHTFGEICMTGL